MIKIRKRWELPESEVTPESVYRRRREFIKAAGAIGGALLLNPAQASIAIGEYRRKAVSIDEEITEGRDLFRSRVTPELFRKNFFDRAIVDRVIKPMAALKTPIW